MLQNLLILHSSFRWAILLSLIYATINSFRKHRFGLSFTKSDDLVRHWTATLAHIQLVIGIILFFKSPVVKFSIDEGNPSALITEHVFFRYIHISLMILSVVIITIGSAKAKRIQTDSLKFKTMAVWFLIALLIIFLAIPWPFSPLVNRPYIRPF